MKAIYSLRRSWTPADYRALIDMANTACRFFMVVVRKELSPEGQLLLERLSSFLVEKRRSKAWPGTHLLGKEEADVYKYRMGSEAGKTLKQVASNLWEWHAPNSPEDLSFLREDGTPWFGSIGHEEDAFFKISDFERAELAVSFGQDSLEYDCPDELPEERY